MVDVSNCIADASYRLGFLNLTELDTGTYWVTPTELYQWADEAIKKLAYKVGLFVVWDASIRINPGTAIYNLPANHVFTVFAALQFTLGGGFSGGVWGGDPWGTQPWGGSSVVPAEVMYQLLRITRAVDLWSLDGNWPTSIGNSVRASFDAGSVGTITLYPSPVQAGTLVQICQAYPPDVTASSSQVTAPSIIQDYLSYAQLAGARGKESELADGPMADHYKKRCEMFEQIFEHLYGPGE